MTLCRPSLRAKRSNPASLRRGKKAGLLRRFAPRNDAGLLCPQLPFIRSVIRLIDSELVHRGLPQVVHKAGRPEIDLALCDLVRERAVELHQRVLDSEQLFQPHGLSGFARPLQRELPRYEIERVDADAELEGVVALDRGRDLGAEKIRD